MHLIRIAVILAQAGILMQLALKFLIKLGMILALKNIRWLKPNGDE
ncbi:hypothetical protein ACFOG5_11305 [Pedobacter fastidiosus]